MDIYLNNINFHAMYWPDGSGPVRSNTIVVCGTEDILNLLIANLKTMKNEGKYSSCFITSSSIDYESFKFETSSVPFKQINMIYSKSPKEFDNLKIHPVSTHLEILFNDLGAEALIKYFEKVVVPGYLELDDILQRSWYKAVDSNSYSMTAWPCMYVT